jgi:hypothetical protein
MQHQVSHKEVFVRRTKIPAFDARDRTRTERLLNEEALRFMEDLKRGACLEKLTAKIIGFRIGS